MWCRYCGHAEAALCTQHADTCSARSESKCATCEYVLLVGYLLQDNWQALLITSVTLSLLCPWYLDVIAVCVIDNATFTTYCYHLWCILEAFGNTPTSWTSTIFWLRNFLKFMQSLLFFWHHKTPVHVVEWLTHSAAMCNRAWCAQWPVFDSARAHPPARELFLLIPMHVVNKELIPGR